MVKVLPTSYTLFETLKGGWLLSNDSDNVQCK